VIQLLIGRMDGSNGVTGGTGKKNVFAAGGPGAVVDETKFDGCGPGVVVQSAIDLANRVRPRRLCDRPKKGHGHIPVKIGPLI